MPALSIFYLFFGEHLRAVERPSRRPFVYLSVLCNTGPPHHEQNLYARGAKEAGGAFWIGPYLLRTHAKEEGSVVAFI